MIIRKLVSLYRDPDIYPRKRYISFGYYERDESGRCEWTGDSEECRLTDDELYEMVKPKLVAKHVETSRSQLAWGERPGL